MKSGQKNLLLGILVVVVVALAVFLLTSSVKVSPKNSINVEGTASVEAMPDLVSIYFNVETSGETILEARNENSLIIENLKTELTSLGIDESEIITQSFNIYEEYDWKNNERKLIGYKASHQIRVKISTENSEMIGEIIDAGVESGAPISYINFELSQNLQNQYRAEAMKLAAQDAKTKAEAVAEGFDKKLGRLVSTTVSDFGYYPWNIYTAKSGVLEENAADAATATTNIQPGEQEVTARITATFKIR